MLLKAKILHEKDEGKSITIGQGADDNNIRQPFYRVVNIHTFYASEYGQDVHTGSSLIQYRQNDNYCIKVKVPPAALEALSEAVQQFGNPLQGKIIDLCTENQAKITEEYQTKTGMFAYLKRNAPHVT